MDLFIRILSEWNIDISKEQLKLLKGFVRQEIKALIQREALAGRTLSLKSKEFED